MGSVALARDERRHDADSAPKESAGYHAIDLDPVQALLCPRLKHRDKAIRPEAQQPRRESPLRRWNQVVEVLELACNTREGRGDDGVDQLLGPTSGSEAS